MRMKAICLLFMSVIFSLVANAQMYLDVVSPLKHLGSVASKDVICDNEGNPCAKIMFEISVDDVVFSSPSIVGSATKKTGRYECFVSVPKTQNVNITLSHHSYGSVIVPLYCEGQPLVSREAYHVKIESKVFESYSGKYAEMQKTNIPELKNLDTRYVCNMSYMFFSCEKLKNLNVSHFNTTNVETMFAMFWGCRSLTSLDLINFNTSKVTNMSRMFLSCESLTSLDLSNFNTSKVTNMSEMFCGCNSLTSLNLSNFNTSKVTNMSEMFCGCNSLTSLNLSNFNTSKVTNMSEMFCGCDSLTSLNLSNFNTANVKRMDDMFAGCKNLTSLDLSNFNTANVKRMDDMFAGCENLTSLDLSNFNTAKVEWMDDMFAGCENLTSLDLSNFNISADANCRFMFGLYHYYIGREQVLDKRCKSLKTIKVTNCNQTTINKIKEALREADILNQVRLVR